MSIKIECNICGKELNEPGMLIFDEQLDPETHFSCLKRHICVKCATRIRKFIWEYRGKLGFWDGTAASMRKHKNERR